MAKYISRLLIDLAAFDLVPRIAEGREDFVLGLVHEEVAVGEIENLAASGARRCDSSATIQSFQQIWKATAVLPVPVAIVRSTRRSPLQDRLDGPVDGDLLVVALALADRGDWRASAAASALGRRSGLAALVAAPRVRRALGNRASSLPAGGVVELDDLVAVGGVGELQAKHLRVFLRLLQAVAGSLVGGLGLDHREREIARVAEQVVRPACGGLRTKPLPTGTMRPSVIVRCSAMECGSLSQPAACSLGTTNFRQVSASFSTRCRS